MTKPQYSGLPGLRTILVPAALVLVCIVLAAFGDAAREALRYERVGLLEGQLWRAVTGHLVHLSTTHALLNLAGFALLVWLFVEQIRPAEWLTAGLMAALAITLGLFTLAPATDWYVGLSGILHGFFALGAARTCQRQRRFGLAMLLALAAKLTWEQALGTMPFTQALQIGPVIVDAHLFGALGGGLFYVISAIRTLVGRSGTPL